MEKIQTLKQVKVNGLKCTAVVGMVVVNDVIYVLTTHSDNGRKQPCVLHKIGKTYKTIVVNDGKGIAVHANSLAYEDHIFYVVTRNGAGEKYNQVIGFDSNGVIKKKHKYMHPKSKIATLSIDKGRWFISVNGGNKVRCREVIPGENLTDAEGFDRFLLFDTPDDAVGNDITIKDGIIYATKTDMRGGWILSYDMNYIRHRKWFIMAPSWDKFEVEGCFPTEDGMLICVNGVIDGKQDDGVWRL